MAREPHRSSEILDAVALLVVDMQDAFLNVMPDREAVLRRTALAIESARAFGIKVIFTEQVPQKLGPTHAALRSLAPEARVFAKSEFSALLAEGLHEYLRRINVYHLLLAGLETPICIYQTALHAQDNELDVTILSDCTTGRRPEDSYVVLESLARAECHVLPAETVFYSMLGSAQNPRFPHFTRIVKRYSAEEPIDGTPTPAPESEPRHEGEHRHGERHDGGRHGDRHERRHGERHHERREPVPAHETAPDAAEPTDDLPSEDGISEAEANQPSYEEATAEHSDVEDASHGAAEPAEVARAERPEPEEGSDDDNADSEEGAEGEDAAEAGEEAPKKKRGRRRRGGARRRRARERAAAASSGGQSPAGDGAGGGSGEGGGSAPPADTPPAG